MAKRPGPQTDDLIKDQRRHIDRLDDEILTLLDARSKLALRLLEFKVEWGVVEEVTGRHNVTIKDLQSRQAKHLSPEFIENVWTLIFEETLDKHNSRGDG